MNTKNRTNFINSLNDVINEYVYNCNLFNGGCCYSAYVLTKVLEKAGIKYKVKMFQYQDVLNTNRFSAAINGNGVAHVAIAVRMNGSWKIIGSCDGIYRYFNRSGKSFKVWSYDNITPEQILEGYKNNTWNYLYNTANNRHLKKDINKVAAIYDAKANIKVVTKNFIPLFLW